ncbi:PASTA domain-containing protein, partial [Virgisporangium aurantiacum]|uniref:PASTA domain-containing protein n=1 Tax=Virgisporangium aurantiacum TaxID=175570 RepID=UPI00194F4C45
LAGKTPADATQALSAEGLTGTQESAGGCPQANLNKIISQDPAANAKVAEGSMVTFRVCSAPDKVPVPDLLGKSRADAEKLVTGAGLKPSFNPVDSAEAKDTVVGTSPGAGAAVAPNSTVTVNISKNNQHTVPDLSGKTESEAKDALKSDGFDPAKLRIVPQAADDDDIGRVISQNPRPDSVAFKNATITIVIGQKKPNSPTNPQPSIPSPSGS